MAFPPFRPPGQDKPSPARAGRKRSESAAPALSVDELRRQARVRLLGALVLVAAAIIGLPMLFSSQPRPVAVQAPVVIPDRDQVAPLPPPPSSAASARSSQIDTADSLNEREELIAATGAAPEPPAASARPQPLTPYQPQPPQPRPAADKPAEKPDEKPAAKPAKPEKTVEKPAKPAEKPARPAEKPADRKPVKPADKPVEKPAEKPADKAADKPRAAARESSGDAQRALALLHGQGGKPSRAAEASDGDRARALLEGRSAKPADKAADKAADKPASKPAAGSSRFFIQIGAFADAAGAASARQKAERAGVHTYTQAVSTAAGQRTRVRAGPFSSREEADKAAAALKRAGLPSAVQAQ